MEEGESKHAIAPAAPKVSAEEAVVLAIQALEELHAERVQIYRQWDQGFKEYLAMEEAVDNWKVYEDLVKDVTGKFADVSKNVRFVGTEFDTYERGDLAELVRIIQEHEKEKLRLTTELQSGRLSVLFKQIEGEEEVTDWVWERQAKEKTHQIHVLMEKINEALEEIREEKFKILKY